MRPARRATSCVAFAWTLLVLVEARAHIPLYGVGTACRVVFKEDRVLLTFDLSYDNIWAQAEMIAADKDKSSSVEEEEAQAYRKKQWDEKISPRVKVRFDGKEIPFLQVGARHEGLVGEIYGVPFSLYYELEAAFPGGSVAKGSVHTLEIEDTVVRDETPAKPQFFVPYKGHGLTETVRFNPLFTGEQSLELDSYLIYGSPLRVKFSFDSIPGAPAAAVPKEEDTSAPGDGGPSAPRPPAPAPAVPGRAAEAPPPVDAAAPEAELERAVRDFDRLPWYTVLGFILLAIAYGAGHALAPGHGKAMVAAYLIGSRGKVRDAVVLGLATTVTHTGSVFLFGLAIFLVVNAGARHSEGALHNMVIVGTQLISGLLLLVLGLILFVRRARRLEGHGHHHHAGDHGHAHEPGHAHGEHHHHEHDHDHPHPHGHDQHPPPVSDPATKEHGGEHPPPVHHHDHHHHHEDHHHEGHHHHDHHHGHHHHHDGHDSHHHHHHHNLPAGLLQGGTPRLRDLVALGFSGGIVPCPAGLTVILIGLHYPERLLFVLALLVFFSIGLGAVLTGIGVSLVAGKALLASRAREGEFFQQISFLRAMLPSSFLAWLDRVGLRLFKLLPALSALFIAALGAFFCASTYATGKTELAAMLRQLAEWIQ